MIKDDGTVIHFNNPKVQASLAANTFAVTGHGENKQITELLPGILNQLGAESLTHLKKLASNVGAGEDSAKVSWKPFYFIGSDLMDLGSRLEVMEPWRTTTMTCLIWSRTLTRPAKMSRRPKGPTVSYICFERIPFLVKPFLSPVSCPS